MKKSLFTVFIASLLYANQPSFEFLQNEITLNKNQCAFDINDFDENPSTGYSWDVKYDDKIFNTPSKDFLLNANKAGMVGVSGKTTFYFRLKNRLCNDENISSTKLTFTLQRAWEDKPIKTKTVDIKFNYSK